MYRFPQRMLILLFVMIHCAKTMAEPIPFATGTHVVVTTSDGRTHEGQVSAASSAEQWELVEQDGGIRSSIVIPVANIVHVAPVTARTTKVTVRPAVRTEDGPSETTIAAQPQWIETTARLLDTDNDPFPDSIEIRVAGFSRDGRIVPLSGSLDARLIGLHQQHSSRAPRLTQLERWNPKIAPNHRQGQELVFILPLRNRRTCDPSFGWAKLKVRLNTPSQGSWDAETSVFLRDDDPFEEQWLIQRHRWSLGSPNVTGIK